MRLLDVRVVWTSSRGRHRCSANGPVLTVAAIAWGTVAILMLLAFGEGLGPPDDAQPVGDG